MGFFDLQSNNKFLLKKMKFLGMIPYFLITLENFKVSNYQILVSGNFTKESNNGN